MDLIDSQDGMYVYFCFGVIGIVLRLPVDTESAYWIHCLTVTSRYRECLLGSMFNSYQ